MRSFVILATLFVASVPDRADACSGYCGNERFFLLYADTTSPVPRDGAVVFRGGAGGETCIDELAPYVELTVRHAGAVVPGKLEAPGGTGMFVFVPDDPWLPEAKYTATITIDNTVIAPPLMDWCATTEDTLSESFGFVTSAGSSPPLPALPAPVFTADTWPIDDRFDAIVCCPTGTPESDDSAGCDLVIQWFAPDVCAYLFEQTTLLVDIGGWTPPPALAGQVLYELFLDGALVASATDLTYLGVRRSGPTCASLRATHLGTRERVESPTVCTPADLVEALGVHPRDVAAELACTDPVLCGDGDAWDAGSCVPFDPQALPTAPDPAIHDDVLESACPGLRGSGKPAAEGSTAAPDDSDSTDSSDAAGPDELAGRQGCGCSEAPPSPHLFMLTLLALWRRRARVR